MSRPSWRNAQHIDRPELASAQTGFYDTKRGWTGDRPKTSASETLVYNDTGATVNAYDILEVVSVTPLPSSNLTVFQAGPTLIGRLPKRWAYRQRFVVCKQTIAAGQTGPCWTTGVVPVRLSFPSNNTVTSNAKYFAQVRNNWKNSFECVQINSGYGFPVLWVSETIQSGYYWGLVDITSHHEQAGVITLRQTQSALFSLSGTSFAWPLGSDYYSRATLVPFENIPGTHLKLFGPTAWMGTISGFGSIAVATEVSGSNRRTRPVIIQIKASFGATDIDWSSQAAPFYFRSADMLVPSDVTTQIIAFSFVIPFWFLTKNASHSWIRLEVMRNGGSGTLDLYDTRLLMHEVTGEAVLDSSDPHTGVVVLGGQLQTELIPAQPAMESEWTVGPGGV